MAGPLNGIGGQQVPLATTFQPGQNSQQVRQQQQSERQNNTGDVQTRNSQSSASSQRSETASNQNILRSLADKALSPDGNEKTEQRRGSTIDITV